MKNRRDLHKTALTDAPETTVDEATTAALSTFLSTHLNQYANQLEPELVQRLAQARAQALQAMPASPASTSKKGTQMRRTGKFFRLPVLTLRPLIYGFAVAVMAVVAITVILPDKETITFSSGVGSQDALPDASVNVIDVLMSNEDIHFLENLEMYEWLAAEYG